MMWDVSLALVASMFILSSSTTASAASEPQATGLPPVPAFTVTEGDIPFNYNGKNFTTHFKLFGNISRSSCTPLIVLHGGPGLSYDYLSPFSDLTEKSNTPVILYDQIGNGRSSHYPDAPASFWNLDVFMDELQNVVNHFSIGNSFALVGHSWGSSLAAEFTIQRQPHGLKRLVLSSGPSSRALMSQSNAQLLQEFPLSVQQGMMGGFADPAAFEVALKAYYAVHGNRVVPPPEEYLKTLDFIFGPNADPTVAISGVTPGNWSLIDRLPLIKPKTLVINGRYDIVQDFVVAPFVEYIPKVKWVKFNASSHMPFWEERAQYMHTVGKFLMN